MNLRLHTALLGILLMAPSLLLAQWSDSSHINNPVAPSPYEQVDARVVPDGAGGAIIAWREYRPSTGYDLFAQRVDSNGVTLWTEAGVAVTEADGPQDQPQVTGDRFGGAVVAWRDFRNGTDYNIFAQRIDSSGAPVWTADGVSVCGTGEAQGEPQLDADGGGGATIAWEDYRSGTTFDIYAQRIDGAGDPAWTTDGIAVSFAAGDQVNPRIATDAGGRAVIAWEDSRSGTSWDVFAQRLNTSGILMWNPAGEAICTAAQSQGSVDVANDGSGGSFLVWQDDRSALSTDVYAQRLTSAGGILWTPGGVPLSTATNHQFAPRVVPLGSGNAAFSWYDLRNGSDYDVYAQRINADGSAAWLSGGLPIGTASGSQVDPSLVTDGAGGAIVAWKDGRGPSNNIFAQNVLAGGTLGILPYVLATAGPNGTISPAGVTAVERGGGLTVTFHPATGFHVDSVFVNGVHAGAPASYTFTDVRGDSTIRVVFAINVYFITAIAEAHGSISQPGATAVVHGQTQAYGITPDSGYAVGLLLVDGAEVEVTTYYLFTNITASHTIHVWFVNDSTAHSPVARGWNIVSAPLVAGDYSTTVLYPSASTLAYLFDGAYLPAPVMEGGRGYWLKFDSAEVITLDGGPLHLDTIDVAEGWNMVGSISVDVPVGSIESVPGGIVTSQFFGYTTGYAPVSTIRPARGYWVKASQPGQLVLSAAPSASPAARITIVPTDELPPGPPDPGTLTGLGPPAGGSGNPADLPGEFRLDRNFPNPFNPSTTIRFSLPAASDVLLEVYSVTGERVARLADERLPAGVHTVRWDASGLAGGVYFCRISAGPNIATRKLLLVK